MIDSQAIVIVAHVARAASLFFSFNTTDYKRSLALEKKAAEKKNEAAKAKAAESNKRPQSFGGSQAVNMQGTQFV